MALVERLRSASGSERTAVLRKDMQDTMDMNAQVYRTEATLKQALSDVQELKARYADVSIQDKGTRYNTDLIEAIAGYRKSFVKESIDPIEQERTRTRTRSRTGKVGGGDVVQEV